ncbi:MAG: PD-(D/E)XK nuclease family protein, partial [Oscillospiraceae bacterium]
FCITLDKYIIEGEIDLLCYNDDTEALIVDYKTGGCISEPHNALYEKHKLQAQCYAYACLSKGFGTIRLVFARVEQQDDSGMQFVSYEFSKDDLDSIKNTILEILATNR